VIEDLCNRLEPDDVVYDIGGGVGYYSIIAASKVPDGAVHSFEPNVRNTLRIAEHARLNGCVDLITTHRVALTDYRKSVPVWIANERIPDVTYVTGDEFVPEKIKQPPTVVKIDVQGAELKALQGLETVLSQPECRLVYCEIHVGDALDYAITDTERNTLETLLSECGFEVEAFHSKSNEVFLRAIKN
jgi:FkbM family methyltransferase